MSVDLSKCSIVQWFEGTEKHRCGYCKTENSISQGMWAESLNVEDYQELIDRGWRRSGKYCYKSIMEETCCPLYTIKCDAINFSLSKSQKKVIKRFNKFLKDGEIKYEDHVHFDDLENCSEIPQKQPKINLSGISTSTSNSELQKHIPSIEEPSTSYANEIIQKVEEKREHKLEKPCDNVTDSSQLRINTKTPFKEGAGADPNKPPSKKAKILRIERKKMKGLEFHKSSPTSNQKSLEQFLEEVSETDKKKLRICLIPTNIPNSKWKATEDLEFQLYKKYQMVIHNDPPSKLSLNGFERFLVKSPLKITLERMSLSSSTFALSAELYKNYQIRIHDEDPLECTEDQFDNFLVETPLQLENILLLIDIYFRPGWKDRTFGLAMSMSMPKNFPEGVDGEGYGSFHQQYWINDRLIAVGVIDILPRCVSSVYFFYDPDYRNLTLGTYGSLREVQLTRQLQKNLPDISSYYMGFYIHSCPKMRYKGKLTPSYLVCPETYHWIPIERCIQLLEAKNYTRLNEDIDAIDVNFPTERDILKIKLVLEHRLMTYADFIELTGESEKFKLIGNLIGRKCCETLVFWEQ